MKTLMLTAVLAFALSACSDSNQPGGSRASETDAPVLATLEAQGLTIHGPLDVPGGLDAFAVLAITTSLLNGCGTVRSEDGRLATCPPVVEYGREFQARAAEELARLPEGSMIAEMLSEYAVTRDQARACH
ncbi:hypothetical protein ACFPLB_07555 [Aquamicrobium segne]|uniref:Lipoprotein n=1 Tax=Aquamicrobium segne TaxID=469547 RepID=A0ABW0GVX4_9HYPH